MRSFRAQVVLWTTLVVGLAIVGVSTAISALNLSRISDGIDRDLTHRARDLSLGRGPMGRPGPRTEPPLERRFSDQDADRIGAIRSPRRLDLEGRPVPGFPGPSEVFDAEAVKSPVPAKGKFSEVDYRGLRVRVFTLPVVRDGQVGSYIQVARELRDFYEVRTIQGQTLAVFLPLGLLGAVAVALFLTGRVVEPIRQMGAAAKAIGAGDLGNRLKVKGDDEFARLGREFNQMADNVEASVSRLEIALDQQRRFTADASHELRTPLTRILMATSGTLENESDYKDAVAASDAAARDMAKLVGQLLALAQFDSSDIRATFGPLDLRLVVSEALESAPGGSPVVELPESAVNVVGNQDQLRRAVVNLLENAHKYGSSDRPIEVRLLADSAEAKLTVRDFGPGVSRDDLGRLTDRFFRVDSARSREAGGTGLGLAIVKETTEAHGGRLILDGAPGEGLSATVVLPVSVRAK